MRKKKVALFLGCYRNIDELPIYNWHKLHTTGDLRFLIMEGQRTPKLKFFLPYLWRVLYDQYIAAFGFGEQFLEILNQEVKIALYTIEKAQSGDDTLETRIDIEEQRLEKKRSEKSNIDFFELKANLDKHLGFTIDTKKCSVREFYSYLNIKK